MIDADAGREYSISEFRELVYIQDVTLLKYTGEKNPLSPYCDRYPLHKSTRHRYNPAYYDLRFQPGRERSEPFSDTVYRLLDVGGLFVRGKWLLRLGFEIYKALRKTDELPEFGAGPRYGDEEVVKTKHGTAIRRWDPSGNGYYWYEYVHDSEQE